MSTIYCRGCGQQIHETAPACPHCGAPQAQVQVLAAPAPSTSPWMSWVALACGIASALVLFADDTWTSDEVAGMALFAMAAIVLGAISLAQRRPAKGIAITGVVLGALGFLMALGSFA